MKVKKARKRLRQVDGLLEAVIDRCNTDGTGVRELLGTAKKAVADAMTSLEKPPSKKPARVATPGQRRLSGARRKRLSAAAKKRGATAKSRVLHEVTGRPLHQTA